MTETTEQDNQTLPAGTMVNGYRVERELGRGAMSVVYLAQQLDLQRPVALKVLAAELAADKEFVRRFFNEARAAAALSHPHIIQAYDAGVAEGAIYYFCMEFVEGETLLQRIQREGRLPLEESLKLAMEVASALDFGYQRYKFTHGDIKPDNIMLNQFGQAKLADFGLAKVEGHDFDGSEVMLTPLYAPPELIRGERRPGDCRGDVYAFGATLYHLIAGSPPFPGSNAQEVMDRHLHENPEPLRLRYPKVPLGLSEFIGRMLAKAPERRPQSWQEVLAGLRQCQFYLANLAGSGNSGSGKKPFLIKPALTAVDGATAIPPRPAAAATAGGGDRRTRRLTLTLVLAVLACCLGLTALVAGLVRNQRRPPAAPLSTRLVPTATAPSTVNGAATAATDSPSAVNRQPVSGDATQSTDESGQGQPGLAAGQATPTTMGSATAPITPAAGSGDDNGDGANTEAGAGAGAEAGAGAKTAAATTGTEPPQKIPEATRTEDDPAATRPAFRLRLPQTAIALERHPHQLDQEIWIEAAQCLGRLQYDLGQATPVEPMMQTVQEWLSAHPRNSEAAAFMRFVHDTALPALEELKAKLVQNKDSLLGLSLTTRRRQTIVLHDITFVSIEVDAMLPGDRGKYRQALRWNQAKSEGLLDELCRLLFLRPEAALADLRTMLAFMAFTGRTSEISRLLQSRPEESLERRHWEMLPKIEAWAGKTEADGLKAWQRLLQACQEGSAATAYALAARLRKSGTVIAGLYREQLDDLLNRCQAAVPEQQGGELLRQAQAAIQQDRHAEAMPALLLAQARFGLADFPEKNGLPQRLQAVQSKLPSREWLGEQELRQIDLAPFVFHRPSAPWPAWSAIACREAAASERRALSEHPGLAQMTEWSQLEMGDWAGPLASLEKKLLPISSLEDQTQKLAATFGAGLLQERFGASLRLAENALGQLTAGARQPGNTRPVEIMALPVRYALLTRLTGRLQPRDYVLWTPGPPPDGGANAVHTFLLLALTAFLEAGDQDAVQAARQSLNHQAAAATDLNPQWLRQLATTLQQLGETNPEINFMASPPNGEGSIAWLRLRLAATGERRLAAAADQPFMTLVETTGAGWPLEGGELVYTWLLRRCGDLIAVGDLEGARQRVDWSLKQPWSCLFPYYARLHFLKAGIGLLGGSRGPLADGAVCVNAATVASEAEKWFLQAMARREDPAVLLPRLPADHPVLFWGHWLSICHTLADQPAPAPLRLAAWAGTALTGAEKHLCRTIETFRLETEKAGP